MADTKVRFNSPLPRHNRVLTKVDFERLGVDHGKIDVKGGEVFEVPEEVANALVELGEFEKVSDEEAAKAKAPQEQMTDSTLGQSGEAVGGGQSLPGAGTRDGAGARSTAINR